MTRRVDPLAKIGPLQRSLLLWLLSQGADKKPWKLDNLYLAEILETNAPSSSRAVSNLTKRGMILRLKRDGSPVTEPGDHAEQLQLTPLGSATARNFGNQPTQGVKETMMRVVITQSLAEIEKQRVEAQAILENDAKERRQLRELREELETAISDRPENMEALKAFLSQVKQLQVDEENRLEVLKILNFLDQLKSILEGSMVKLTS